MNDLLQIQFSSEKERDLFMDWINANFSRYIKETKKSVASCLATFEKEEYGYIEIE